MAYRTETYDLEAELERLQSRLEEIAEEVAGLPDDAPRAQRLLAEGQQLEPQRAGVHWAIHNAHDDEDVPQWDADVNEVTLSGLTGGEYKRLQTEVQSDADGAGSAAVLLVADGTEEAPYVGDDMTDKQRTVAVDNLPYHYIEWAEARVSELTGVGEGNGTTFGDLLAAARDSETSTGE